MKIKLFRSVFASLFIGLLTLSYATYSIATPFSITYTGTIGTSTGDTLFPEVNEGESYSLTLVFDNGSANALSQTWGEADLTCATFLVNDAQDVQFSNDLTVTPEGYNNGEISTDGTGILTSNFSGIYYDPVTSTQYEAVGIQLTDPVWWFANGANNVFMSDDGDFQFGDAAGGVLMAPANWSDPVPYGGTCGVTAQPPTTYTVGGTVSGLTGTGLALQNNGADTLPVTADGPFTFLTELVDTSVYAVTVSIQPTGQTCSVTNGNGAIATADVTNVGVTCEDDVTPPMEPPPPATPIPTTSQWALIMLSMLFGLVVFANRRRLF